MARPLVFGGPIHPGGRDRGWYAGVSSLAREPRPRGSDDERGRGRDREAHRPHELSILSGTPLEKKLTIAPVDREQTSAPMLKVTGSIVARLPPGKEKDLAEGRWDFNTPDLSSAYADWIKARADVPFNEKQLLSIQRAFGGDLEGQEGSGRPSGETGAGRHRSGERPGRRQGRLPAGEDPKPERRT